MTRDIHWMCQCTEWLQQSRQLLQSFPRPVRKTEKISFKTEDVYVVGLRLQLSYHNWMSAQNYRLLLRRLTEKWKVIYHSTALDLETIVTPILAIYNSGRDVRCLFTDWEFVTYDFKIRKNSRILIFVKIRFCTSLVTRTFRNHATPIEYNPALQTTLWTIQ